MTIDLKPLTGSHRLLFDAKLKPLQGKRFQPTGFPGLGAAEFGVGNNKCLLVESAQSMANRFEAVCWDPSNNAPVAALDGISHVTVTKDGEFYTDSLLEAHRLNSPYILENDNKTFIDELKSELDTEGNAVSIPDFAKVLVKYDINSIIHGIFISKKEIAGGRFRLARSLSAFIEAENVQVAASGGVKNDHVDPSGDAKAGFGNVPFSRDEYTATDINLYVSLDLAQIRGLKLGNDVETLLILLALYKIRAFVDGSMRLRTACDFELEDKDLADRSGKFKLPALKAIESDLKSAIKKCQAMMTMTSVEYNKKS